MEPVLTVEQAATFAGAAALVVLIMGVLGKPIIRRLLNLLPGEDVPAGSGYPIVVNVVSVVIGIVIALVARAVVDNGLDATTAFNAVLVGLSAGIAGTGVSEIWGNSVTLIRR